MRIAPRVTKSPHPSAIGTPAAYQLYRKSPTVTDYKVFADRGHSLTIDRGWKEVANASLSWLKSKGL